MADKPENPLSRLLSELSRIFGALPQTPENERAAYIMALRAVARLAEDAACKTQDMGLWQANRRLLAFACALGDLDNNRVAPMLEKAKSNGSPPDNMVKWSNRVDVLGVMYALEKSGMTKGAAPRHIAKQRSDLKDLMTRGKDLPATIQRWRRKLDEAKKGTPLWEVARQRDEHENHLAELLPSNGRWRQFADTLLARIQRY